MALTVKFIDGLKPEEKPKKYSDGGGLYLLVQPTGGKLWQMGYRFGGKQKTLSIGVYGAHPDVPLKEAREKRDDARKELRNGRDPHAAKMAAKQERKEAKTFGAWADEWMKKERAGGDTEKTLDNKETRLGYLKTKFGKVIIEDIKREEVLGFLRGFEDEGKLETRDRVRAIGEKICNFADDEEGDKRNPFRPFSDDKLVKKVTVHRPALIESEDVAHLFKLMAKDRKDTIFDDLVGLALRFISLTVVRDSELGAAEWKEINFEKRLWIIPGPKMKERKEHAVPLSRQAIAILENVRGMTGKRRYVFSCGKDAPLSESALCKRLRFLGYDTKTEHCPHGYRTTFSTLLNGECDMNDVKLWDGDLIELQLAHVEEASVKAIYNRVGALSLIGARAKMMQHWADRIDTIVQSGEPVPFRKLA